MRRKKLRIEVNKIMAILAGDFRTGLTLTIEGDPWVVLDFQHVKPGKGAAILKTKMKNLRTGATQNRNFNANTKFEQAHLETKKASYSYADGSTYYFMDIETYDMYELAEEQVDFKKYFLNEGMEVSLVFYEGDLWTLEIPEKVEVTIAETAPAIKGAPSNQTKDAVTDTGLKVLVPQFIAEGEKVMVYTADGKYAGRA